MLPKARRVSRNIFPKNNEKYRSASGNLVSIKVFAGVVGDSKTKISCIVSKKVAAKAVERNLVRRRCNSVFQGLLSRLEGGRRVIVYAKKQIKEANHYEINFEIKNLLSKLNVFV